MSDSWEHLPSEAVGLVKFLDKTYPHRCPPRYQKTQDVRWYAAQRELIDNLLIRYGLTRKHEEEI